MKTYKVKLYAGYEEMTVGCGLSLPDAVYTVAVKNGSTDRCFCKYAGGQVVIISEADNRCWWNGKIEPPTSVVYGVSVNGKEVLYSSFEKAYLSILEFLNSDNYELYSGFIEDLGRYDERLFDLSLTSMFSFVSMFGSVFFRAKGKGDAHGLSEFFPIVENEIRIYKVEIL